MQFIFYKTNLRDDYILPETRENLVKVREMQKFGAVTDIIVFSVENSYFDHSEVAGSVLSQAMSKIQRLLYVSVKQNSIETFDKVKLDAENKLIVDALEKSRGDLQVAASITGVSKVTFWRKVRKYIDVCGREELDKIFGYYRVDQWMRSSSGSKT